MRFPPLVTIAGACAAVLVGALTPGVGAVGDVTTFPTAAPTGGAPTHATLGPDGAMWFGANYYADPGTASAFSRRSRTARVRRETGGVVCCARLIRVTTDGEVTSRGRPVFGDTAIGGIASAGGSLWVSTIRAPYRIWRYGMDGAATPFSVAEAPGGLVAGPDGALWFETTAGIGRMGTDGQVLPGYAASINQPLASGLDAVWGRVGSPALVRVSAGGGTTEFPTGFSPGSIAASPDGSVWYSDAADQAIGRLVPGGGRSEVPGGADFAPAGIAVSADGAAWVVSDTLGRVYRFDPSMGMRTITIAGAVLTSSPGIGSDGNLWLTYRTAAGGFQFARVLTGVLPVATKEPTASGKVKAGQVLTSDPGAWTNAPLRYAYAWQRCTGGSSSACTPIPGASSPTYAVTAEDAGSGVRVLVSATNLNGMSEARASNMLTGSTAPAAGMTLGRSTRKGYVISTPVTVTESGTLRQTGQVPRTRRAKALRACAPRAVRMGAPGRRVIRCSLSTAVRARLVTAPRTIALTTTFVASDGRRVAQTRRVKVPRIPRRG